MKNDNVKLKICRQGRSAGSPRTTFTDSSARVTANQSRNAHPLWQHGVARKSGAGFTLIETFVAITVLLLAVVGPLTIASRGLISASFARDQITAYYLAQEAVELIRNTRDHNILSSQSNWKNGFDACFGTDGCSVDAADTQFNACSGACPALNRDSTGYYSYRSGGVTSPFTRTIRMTDIAADEFSVSVTISWKTGPLSKSFTIQDNFLNWQ